MGKTAQELQLEIRSVSGGQIALDISAIDGLKEHLRGRLLRQGEEGYNSARRIWNAMIDRRPVLIARCASPVDVMETVKFAREHNVLVSVRGGGHSVAGKAVCDGGLMIDLSPMKSVRVDPVARTARAEPGVLWGEFDRETHAFGLATPGGVVATTGIAGLTLGGGQSWLTGKYGLTIDNLLSADVVTTDGDLLHASTAENDDLFWGLRGAGANFGIVTSFEYRLHPVSTVLGGMVLHPINKAPEVLRFYREFSAAQPDELTTYAALLTAPDGNQVISLATCHVGSPAAGERVIEPLRRFGTPVVDTIAAITHPQMQALIMAAFPPGRLGYWKSGMTAGISDSVIETVTDFGRRIPSPFSAIVFADCHGAYSRVGKTDTAYYHRDLQYDVVILSSWVDPAESDRNIGWTRDCFQALEPHLSGGVYVNDLGDESAEGVRNAYGRNYERLAKLKAKYDPTNFLRMNQNILPLQ